MFKKKLVDILSENINYEAKKNEVYNLINLEMNKENVDKEVIIDTTPQLFLEADLLLSLMEKDSKNIKKDVDKILLNLLFDFLKENKLSKTNIDAWIYPIKLSYYYNSSDFLEMFESKFNLATEVKNLGYSEVVDIRELIDMSFNSLNLEKLDKNELEIKNAFSLLKERDELLFRKMIIPLSLQNLKNNNKNIYEVFYGGYDVTFVKEVLNNDYKFIYSPSPDCIKKLTDLLKKCIEIDSDDLLKTTKILSNENVLNINLLDLIQHAHILSKEKAKNLTLNLNKRSFYSNGNNRIQLLDSWLYAKEFNLFYNEDLNQRKKDVKKNYHNENEIYINEMIEFCLNGIRNINLSNSIFLNLLDSGFKNSKIIDRLEDSIKKLVEYLNKNESEKEVFFNAIKDYSKKTNWSNENYNKVEILNSLLDKYDLLKIVEQKNNVKKNKLKF